MSPQETSIWSTRCFLEIRGREIESALDWMRNNDALSEKNRTAHSAFEEGNVIRLLSFLMRKKRQ